jgi:serine/threonine protein kinase/tetratricopeptide (TPR) repeat protein
MRLQKKNCARRKIMETYRNQLFAFLAVRLNLVSLSDAKAALARQPTDAIQEIADALIESGRLVPDDRVHLEYLVERILQTHHGDADSALKSLGPGAEAQSLLEHRPTCLDSVAGVPWPPAPATVPPAPLPFAATVMTEPPPAEKPLPAAGPARFSRVRVHASGGMGRVWLARDRHLERDVALKELRPEFAGNAAVGRRFLVEARVTGRLEHPGIVPIYELVQEGDTVSYAMRFLQGRTLSEAIKAFHSCNPKSPGALERARLLQVFVTVCNTVAFAHARGVLHRDLKGQNILLGDFGEVIVLDWGLAKDMKSEAGPELSGASGPAGPDQVDQTLPGQIMGTPHYMSPEQAAGQRERIDQRSDVYSLGAVLYELLTGQAPFADQSRACGVKTVPELLQRICEQPPTPPRQLAGAVPPPLEAICLRALAKSPDKRYPSAADLAHEVQRWLADEPVQAHPDPWTVRLGRWARRHKTAVTSLGVFLAAVVVGLAATTLLVNQERSRTEQARARAQRNFHKAQEAVDRYFTQVSEDRLLNEPGMLSLRRELLASAREFYDDLARTHERDAASRQALGETQLKLAAITRAMGDRRQALKILEDAQALFAQLARADPDADVHVLGLAQSHVSHGYQTYLLDGRSPDVEAELEKARDLLAKLVRKNPTRLFRAELAHALNTIATYHGSSYKTDTKAEGVKIAQRAEAAYLGAVALWKQLTDEEPNDPARRNDLAGGYTNLAILYANLQDLSKSGDYLDKAMTLRRELAERYPHNLDYQENLAAVYNTLGSYYRELNRSDEAEKAFRHAATLREKLAQGNCQAVQFQQGLGKTYFNLGNLYYLQVQSAAGSVRDGQLAKSKDAYRRALDIYKRLHDDQPGELRARVDYGITLGCMGDLMSEAKKALAIPWYDQAVPLLEEALRQGDNSAVVRRALRNAFWGRAEARTEAGHFAEAVADWDRALELDDGAHKKEWQPKRAQARLETARRLVADGQHQKAAAAVEELLKDAPSAQQKVDAARVLAVCTLAAEEEKKDALALSYAARAVAVVRMAFMDGYFRDNPNATVLAVLRKIDAIARRPDFQKLVKEIGAK